MEIDTEQWEEQNWPSDPVLQTMLRHGMPLTRQSYLEFNYPDGVPMGSPGELDVPRWLRDADEALH
jgi:hypothetical protein